MSPFDTWLRNIHDSILQLNPVYASQQGEMSYADKWPDVSTEGIQKLSRLLGIWIAEAEQFEGQEAELAKWFFEFSKFEIDELRFWKYVPGLSKIIFSGCYSILMKTWMPEQERLKLVAKRLESLDDMVEATLQRVRKPYLLWLMAEVSSFNGLLEYFGGLFRTYPVLLESIRKAMASLRPYKDWLGSVDVIETFPQNTDAYTKLFEMRKLPFSLEEVLSLAFVYLDSTEQELQSIADELGGTIEEVRKKIRSEHPSNFADALNDYKQLAQDAKEFIIERGLLTMPPETLKVVYTPPPLRRFLSIAAAGVPGFFDRDKTGYFYLTPHDDPTMLEEHNYSFQSLLMAHESYPGHHVHGACKNLNTLPARSPLLANIVPFSGLLYSSKLAEVTEGWGLYCEQMMFDQGFKRTSGKEALYKSFLLADALRWRATRVIIDIGLHTGKLSFGAAEHFLMEKTGYNNTTARSEVVMYSLSPGYFLSYLLGKHLLMEMQTKSPLSLKEFHDKILYAGNVPYWFLKEYL